MSGELSLLTWLTAFESCPDIPADCKGIGATLGSFANYHDGRDAWPGTAWLTMMGHGHRTTVERKLGKLRKLGWLIRVSQASRTGGHADGYILAIPEGHGMQRGRCVVPIKEDEACCTSAAWSVHQRCMACCTSAAPPCPLPEHKPRQPAGRDNPQTQGQNPEPTSRTWYRWHRDGRGYWFEDWLQTCSATERPAAPEGYVWLSKAESSQTNYSDKGMDQILSR